MLWEGEHRFARWVHAAPAYSYMRETEKEMELNHQGRDRDWCDHKPKSHWSHWDLKEARSTEILNPLGGSLALQHLVFRLLASNTVKNLILMFKVTKFVLICYSNSRILTHSINNGLMKIVHLDDDWNLSRAYQRPLYYKIQKK